VTRQNSALVEENAATAKTLEHQSAAMGEPIDFFRLGDIAGSRNAAAGRLTARHTESAGVVFLLLVLLRQNEIQLAPLGQNAANCGMQPI